MVGMHDDRNPAEMLDDLAPELQQTVKQKKNYFFIKMVIVYLKKFVP